ncbi:DUF6691 family protein [Galbibacter sp.]|jgi:uncharacterized membrane protein YedE/YeeE|uniref:DUF6691 family protein n=1 Tax=Galbibacter sp. TaxID=2918471 RepID=UPI003A8EB703
MKYIKFIATGMLLGIVLVKSEAVSWYRIFEMFRFESFHMYGIIGSAVLTGVILIQLSKKFKLKTYHGDPMLLPPKDRTKYRYLIGGIIFGLGWALTGACPGPIFTLIGTGLFSMIIVLAAAVAGTFVYGLLKTKLPH